MKSQLRPKPEVVHTELDSGASVLLDLDTHKYFSLNESGAMIWGLLVSGSGEPEVARKLADRYSLDLEKAKSDVERLVSELKDAGLLIETS